MEIKNWRKLERHPLSAEYEDLKGRAWTEFVANMKKHGWIGAASICLYEDKIIEGWQRQRAAIECNIEPDYRLVRLPKDMTIEEWVSTVNDHRRHETQERAMQRADERRERVAAARAEGKSERTIAEEEGVSQKTIHEDIEKSGDTPVSPDDETPKTTGKDGKKYSSKKPKILCPNCQHRKDVGKPPMKEKCPDCAELNKRKKEKPVEPEPEPEEPKDDNGEPWRDKAPKALKAVRQAHHMREMSRQLAGMSKLIAENEELHYYTYSMQSVLAAIKTLKETLLGSIPAYICPYCDGGGKTLEGAQKGKTCEVCERQGWVTRAAYKRSPKGQAT